MRGGLAPYSRSANADTSRRTPPGLKGGAIPPAPIKENKGVLKAEAYTKRYKKRYGRNLGRVLGYTTREQRETGMISEPTLCKCHHALHTEEESPYELKTDRICHRIWYRHGKKHRESGPAEILDVYDGYPICKYYINGQQVNRNEFVRRYEFIYMKKYNGL